MDLAVFALIAFLIWAFGGSGFDFLRLVTLHLKKRNREIGVDERLKKIGLAMPSYAEKLKYGRSEYHERSISLGLLILLLLTIYLTLKYGQVAGQ